MELTKEKTLELHRQMWSDMRDELGDNPSFDERFEFKRDWVKEHFPSETVIHYCFLCEYAIGKEGVHTNVCSAVCAYCPLKWTAKYVRNTCEGYSALDATPACDWRFSPISDILALPER